MDAPSLEVFKAGWMGVWAIWSSGRYPCPWQGSVGTRCSVRSIPTQTILWFYHMVLGSLL